MIGVRRACALVVALSLLGATALAQDDDDAPSAARAAAGAPPQLDAEQQSAVGIAVAHPQAAKTAQEIVAYGQVLDSAALIADAAQLDAARAAESAASADTARVGGLYRGEAGASLKALQDAQAEQARAHAQAEAAAATFAARWAPLAKLPAAQRKALVDAVADGRRLLVRADWLGRQSLGELPTGARLDVDGMQVPARVLGPMAQAAADLRSAGVLLVVDAPPPGFGAGARAGVTLLGAARAGMLVPASALVYAEDGAIVYKQLAKSADGKWAYAAAKVTPLQPQGDAWLVDGLDDDDLVVVRGAGVLWSLQGVGTGAAADDDDD
ncbi:MAG TPA: hypothetical protein VGC30_11505 [Dokdonella sp.]